MSLARPHNYELRIMHYEFPYLSPQLRIMNYELNQCSVAVVDFMLDNLGCKASEFLSLWFEINV